MKEKCPECGSSDIVPDLIVYADEENSGIKAVYVRMIEPEPAKRPFVWIPKDVKAGFRASVCGSCGYTRFYTVNNATLLDAHKKGYKSQEYKTNIISPL